MYVLTDFETSAMAAVMSTWPTTELRGCRFHLGQSCWRRIQQIGLACSYNDKNSDIAKWLLKFVGLSHLNEQFISPHPNIFVFVEILLRVQTGTYVIINCISKTRLERKSIEIAALLQSFYTNYRSGTLSRKDYIKSCSYRFAP